uniref:LETM1 domain-containing protein n=1 Tax=Angiostrongylus cantonensis TaxID=6313 RepID=A0A0K0CSV5_ANGCA
MPVDLPKVAITAVLLPLPFGFYVIGFAIIFFPRLVLTRHFWTDAQRKESFRAEVLKSVTNSSRFKEVIGNPLSMEEVRLPELDQMSANELIALASLYSMLPLPGIARRFKLRCEAMRQLDKIIVGNIASLTERQLNFVRFFLFLEQANFSFQYSEMFERFFISAFVHSSHNNFKQCVCSRDASRSHRLDNI